MDVKEEKILGNAIKRHWYYNAKSRALLKYIDDQNLNNILDVGAGSGFFSRILLEQTDAKLAICVDPAYDHDQVEKYHGKVIQFRRSVENPEVDLVILMDVLEHVEDDVALLKEYMEKVPSGTRFLITVPAFQFLWSGHDEFLEHKRRYTRTSLTKVIRNAGLELEYSSYYFMLVFPLALVSRLLNRLIPGKKSKSQLSSHSNLTNTLLYQLCRLELPFIRRNKLFGLSVFCYSTKP